MQIIQERISIALRSVFESKREAFRKPVKECTVRPVEFFDHDGKYAAFPTSDAVDGSRSCRTFVALQCIKKKKLVHKNLPCAEKVNTKIRS
jgi:hypothetical protein